MFQGFGMEFWRWVRNPWLEWIFQIFQNVWDLGMRQNWIWALFNFLLSRCVQRWLLGWIFGNFSWNLCSWRCWKPLEKNFSPGKKIPETSWGLKGMSGNPQLIFPVFFSKEKCGFWLFEGAENSFFFHYSGNLFPVLSQNSMFKAAPAIVCIPREWELKKKWEL